MKILHFLVTDKFSGAENVQLSILESMKEDNEVYYVSPDGPVRSFVEKAGVNFIPANTDSISEIKRIYREIKPDVVHACDPRMSFKCALAGIPFIAHLHTNRPWLQKICGNSLALYYTVKKAKYVITVSDSIENEYIFKKVFANKLRMIPNIVDREKTERMGAESLEAEYDIIFVGRMNEQKRPSLFLDLVSLIRKEIPDVKVIMLGEGELFDEVKEKKEKEELDNVILHGFDSNPYKYINKSKINVFTSHYEGFGLVAVESMILGKPVLAYPVGGLADIVTSDSGFLCDTNEEMAEKAVKLLKDKELYDSLSCGAYKNSYRYTDKEGYMKKIKEIYRDFVQK